jgi:hypothetical protein
MYIYEDSHHIVFARFSSKCFEKPWWWWGRGDGEDEFYYSFFL